MPSHVSSRLSLSEIGTEHLPNLIEILPVSHGALWPLEEGSIATRNEEALTRESLALAR